MKIKKELKSTKMLLLILFGITIILNLKVSAAFDYVLGPTKYNYSNQTQPAKGQSYVDSTYHTTVWRVTSVHTDGTFATRTIPQYSRYTPSSVDGELLIFHSDMGHLIYRASDFSYWKNLKPIIKEFSDGFGDSELRWDYTGKYSHRLYYRQFTKFYAYDVDTNNITLIHDFKNDFPDAYGIQNDDEGDSSADSRYWAFMVHGPYDGATFPLLRIICYDKDYYGQDKGKIVGVLENVSRPNFVDMSPSGDKVLASFYKISVPYSGPHVFNRDFSNPIRVGRETMHSGWGYDMNGNEVYVTGVGGTDLLDYISMVDVNTGNITPILYYYDPNKYNPVGLGPATSYHFGRFYNPGKRGWIMMSTLSTKQNDTDLDKNWSTNQIFMLELKDKSQNPRIWRISFTQNMRTEDYWSEPHAQMDYNATKIWWGANWRGTDNLEVYQVDLPPTWHEDLSGPVPCHEADLNCNNCIEISELIAFIGKWKGGNVGLAKMKEAVGLWLGGKGC